MSAHSYDLVGLGIGPFNLSLAALMQGLGKLEAAFFDAKPEFQWHPELMLPDAVMQTSWVKDLVTAVAPTSPFSFLNYLVQNKRFYAFLNTSRTVIRRQEFEAYCKWTSRQIPFLNWNSPIRDVNFRSGAFEVRLDNANISSRHLCLGTGLEPFVPDFAKPWLGPKCFHPKSRPMQSLNVEGQRVLIVGGGQTGAEIFLNMLRGRWNKPEKIAWVSRRPNLEPLDESAFTNEYFTPHYVKNFHALPTEKKDQIVAAQKLSSDGITPSYLLEINRELYQHHYVEQGKPDLVISTQRELVDLRPQGDRYDAVFQHQAHGIREAIAADVVILCTGFRSRLPSFMEGLLPRIATDHRGRPIVQENFQMSWDGPFAHRLYAVNFSRHGHGIAEPQTSLMAWRSASILNDMLGYEAFPLNAESQGYIDF